MKMSNLKNDIVNSCPKKNNQIFNLVSFDVSQNQIT